MSLQKCTDISEAVPLDASLGLYLKPASKIKISVQLPKLKIPGQSISTWQVMEKLRATVRPDQFLYLKALKITSTVIKFQGEMETRAASERAIARLQAAAGIKLSGFSEFLHIRAAHAACSGPTRHDWDSFFRDARGVDEMKPGERPDTVHLQDLPASWFSEAAKPSERLLHKAFSNFGRIRRLEIPCNEKPGEEQTFGKTNSLYTDLTFNVYIQYEQYVEFATAMDSLRGMKLLHKDATDGKVYSSEIKVDFDRTNYLSDRNIKKRALEAQKLSSSSCSNAAEKVVAPAVEPPLSQEPSREEEVPQLLSNVDSCCSVENQQEATFFLKELFRRVEVSEKERERKNREKARVVAASAEKEMRRKEKKNQEKLIQQERMLKEKLLRSLKAKEQQKMADIREKLRKELRGRKLLSVLASANSRNTCSKKFR